MPSGVTSTKRRASSGATARRYRYPIPFYIVAKEFIFAFRFAQLVSPLFLPHLYNSKPRLERIVVAGQLG